MNNLFDQIWRQKFAFLGVFFLVFSLTYFVFLVVDFLPEPPTQERSNQSTALTAVDATPVAIAGTTTVQAEPEDEGSVGGGEVAPPPAAALPTMITIERLDKSIPVLNPTSRTIADLDAALLEGVVRHPDSANLVQEGNVFILGHSSYLPNVLNRNFQAFNGIQKLEWGDTIEVTTDDAVYVYRVERVYEARAQDVTVPIANTGHKLTLATCDSFGSVDDRYIVEAKRVDTRSL